MTCDNCISENDLNLSEHIILDGPFNSSTECFNGGDTPKIKSQVSPQQPDCEGCPNTIYFG